jgi:hypothetical protein
VFPLLYSGNISSAPSINNSSTLSASRRKLFCTDVSVDSINDETLTSRNVFVDVGLLSAAVCSFEQCEFCHAHDITICSEDTKARFGLASKLVFECTNCRAQHFFHSSKRSDNGFEINTTFVYGVHTIGKGESAGEALCAVTNLPKGPTRFQKCSRILRETVKDCAVVSMKDAVKEAVECNEGATELTVAVDGTWQHRGHISLHGVVSATSIDTGKVIDVDVLTKYCQRCASAKDIEKLKEHQESHACNINFQGVSGGMEAAGAVAVFTRSVDMHGVRYTKYLGDGDSKEFMKAVEARPYGETEVEKLECIGHVQKNNVDSSSQTVKRTKGGKIRRWKISCRQRETDRQGN